MGERDDIDDKDDRDGLIGDDISEGSAASCCC